MGSPIFGILIGVGASLFEGQMAVNQADAQMQVANQQLRIDIENEKIRAMQEQNKRNTEYLRADSANRVAVAHSGIRNISFEQGLSTFNQKKAYADMQTIEFNKEQEVGRKRYQIQVNRMNAQMEATSARIGSFFDAATAVNDGVSKMVTAGSTGSSGAR